MAVVGPNGAGKTTLLRLMAGTLRPLAGDVAIDDVLLSSLTRQQIACRVAVVAQREDIAFGYRVREVVAMGRAPHQKGALRTSVEDRLRTEAALERSGLHDLAERPVDELSGGEQKRVSIARALAQQASLLLLDEPSASLDVKQVARVFRLVREEAARGTAVVVVTHDLRVAAQYADDVLLLARGTVVAQGPADEVLRVDLLERTFDVPVRLARAGERFFVGRRGRDRPLTERTRGRCP